ncbi:MAG: hypothetical protein Q9159_003579 [Coniocarpon cinnabarinum]
MPSAAPSTSSIQPAIPHNLEPTLRNLLHHLHALQIQAHHHATSPSTLQTSLMRLIQSLQAFSTQSAALNTEVPMELLEYVENGRNPEIYTREFVEMVQRGNQALKGRQDGFRAFGDALSREMKQIEGLGKEVDTMMKERP